MQYTDTVFSGCVDGTTNEEVGCKNANPQHTESYAYVKYNRYKV